MTNLADVKQVKNAKMKEDDLRKQELNDVRTVLSNASGRRLVWRVLKECRTFESVWSQDSLDMARQCGRQDLGHFLMAEITTADENLLLKMMKANNKGDSNE